MTKQFHVYAHFTKTQPRELFYIGCGGKYRANQRSLKDRNAVWHEIVDKHGFESEIILTFDNREDALKEELYLQQINKPRACLTYSEGCTQIITEATKKKISKAHKGRKHTDESRKNMSEAHKGQIPSKECRRRALEANKGRKHTLEVRKKISETRKRLKIGVGCKQPEELVKKRTEANKRPIINCRGEIFDSTKNAASHFNISPSCISACLNLVSGKKSAGKYPKGSKVKWKKYLNKNNKEVNNGIIST